MHMFEVAKRDFGTTERSRTYRFSLKMKVDSSCYYDDEDDEVLIST
jgi:hypothetical protein